MAENGIYGEVKKLATRIANDIVKNHPMLASIADWHSSITNDIKSVRGLFRTLELRVCQLENGNDTIKRVLGMSGETVPELGEEPPESVEIPAEPPMTVRELKKIRNKYSFSQHNMAELLGVSPHRYNRWERGELDVPPEIAADLRAFTSMSAGELRTLMHSRGIFQPNGTVARQQAKPTAASVIHAAQQSRYTAADLRYIRTAAGFSQKRMAEYLGVPQSTYTSWECRQSRMPDKYTPQILTLQENPLRMPEPVVSTADAGEHSFKNRATQSPYTGSNLLALRRGLELSQSQMARLIGVPQNTYATWETGGSDIPDRYTARVNFLVGRDTPPSPIPEKKERVPVDDKEENETISAEECKALRKRLHIDQISFGQMLGISPWRYKKWEQGILKTPLWISIEAKRRIEELSKEKPADTRGQTEESTFCANDLEMIRLRLNMTVKAFAKEVGVSRTSYEIWKKINYNIPARYTNSIKKLSRRAMAIGTNASATAASTDSGPTPCMECGGNPDDRSRRSIPGAGIPAEMLEEKRKELGMTQRDIAQLIGVSLSSYKTWLKNHRSVPEHFAGNVKKLMRKVTSQGNASREKKHGEKPKPSGITAAELKSLRDNLNLTQRKIAAKFGVTTAAYQSWEQGKARMPETYAAQYRRLLASFAADSDIPAVDVIPPESPPSRKTDRTLMPVTPEMLLMIKSAQQEFGLANDKMGRLMDMDEKNYSQLESGEKATIRRDQWEHLTFVRSMPKIRRDTYINNLKGKESQKK